MGLRVRDVELFGVTESSLTLSFAVEDDSGPVDAPARVLLDGEARAQSEGPAATRLVHIEELEPDTQYRIEVQAPGAPAPEPSPWCPASARTRPAPRGRQVASFATLNDLQFGEERFGGVILPDGEYGDDEPGWEYVRAEDSEVPYWRFMNEDAIAEINDCDVDSVVIKGDIADRGRTEQFEAAAHAFSHFSAPHQAFLGNHDYYARLEGQHVDGYALLGQPPAPRSFDLSGWRMLLLETVEPGEHHGVFAEERLAWLDEALAETRETHTPTLLFMHHQPVPTEHRESYPNSIGLDPGHSSALFALIGANPQVQGVLIGHTHRNRVRRYPAAGPTPFVEVNCTKDYPGGWAHYRLFDDGSFFQEVRRTHSERALAHSTRCRDFFRGGYRRFALGSLDDRSFAAGGFRLR